MPCRLVLMLLLISVSAIATGAEEEDAIPSASFSSVTSSENLAGTIFFEEVVRWNADKLRDLSRVIPSLQEPVAIQVLWMVASAPARFETTHVMAAALSSKSPVVRCQAADILVANASPESRRMLLGALSTENDPDVVRHIVTALAMQKDTNRSVVSMMDLMYESDLKAPAVETASAQLRRLTRFRLNTAAEWRDWWLDNEPVYNQQR